MRRLTIVLRLLIVQVLFLLQPVNLQHADWFTKELFGHGQATLLSEYPPIGLVKVSGWGTWFVVGQESLGGYSCWLIQVEGQPIQDYDAEGRAIYRPIPCYFWRDVQRPDTFSGWIDFRGHERRLCGGPVGGVPDRCKNNIQ